MTVATALFRFAPRHVSISCRLGDYATYGSTDDWRINDIVPAGAAYLPGAYW